MPSHQEFARHARKNDLILAQLQQQYGLVIVELTLLPLGADLNATIYRAAAADSTPYFVKLKRGAFDLLAPMVAAFLAEQGIDSIIAPKGTLAGQPWATLEDSLTLLVYPFVEGYNGYERDVSDSQWTALGAALGKLHSLTLPAVLRGAIPQENYSPQWRMSVMDFLTRVTTDTWTEPVAVKTATLLRDKRANIIQLLQRTEALAQQLHSLALPYVLCHADIHAGNVLISPIGNLHLVDCDAPILAPKERDLMSIGAGLFGNWRTPQAEETLFYQGYGQTEINTTALTYYRYERIIADIAAYAEELLASENGEDEAREQLFRYLFSNFLPNGTIAIAARADVDMAA